MVSSAGRTATPADLGLYLHIPFCRSLCGYCRFVRTDRHDAGLRRRLVAGIGTELALRRERGQVPAAARLRTAYVGGGTPSVLEPGLMARLLEGTVGRLPAADRLEVTAEANPEGLDPALAATWREAGVGRVSLGLQSLRDPVLRRLGRACDAATARRGLAVATSAFARVAVDLLIAPGARRRELLADLREVAASGVGHVSLYILEIHPGTPLAEALAAGRLLAPAEEEVERLYLEAVEQLAALGLRQYEVANFARPGQRSRHNAAYWRRRPYLGLGPGAHGFDGRRRRANLPGVASYLRRVEAGRLPTAAVDRLDAAARRLERIVLPLRTVRGVPLARLPGGLPLAEGERQGLWRLDDGRLRLTPRGFLRIDALEELIARRLGEREGPAGRG